MVHIVPLFNHWQGITTIYFKWMSLFVLDWLICNKPKTFFQKKNGIATIAIYHSFKVWDLAVSFNLNQNCFKQFLFENASEIRIWKLQIKVCRKLKFYTSVIIFFLNFYCLSIQFFQNGVTELSLRSDYFWPICCILDIQQWHNFHCCQHCIVATSIPIVFINPCWDL